MPSVISLYDASGIMVAPFIKANWNCYIFDLQHTPEAVQETIHGYPVTKIGGDYTTWKTIVQWLSLSEDIRCVFGQPPCTNLATSGAAHFATKALIDPKFQITSMQLFHAVHEIADSIGVPYLIEQPISVASTLYRKPDFYFPPWEYSGYLPEDHQSLYSIIPPRSGYPKKTSIWSTLPIPEKRPVPIAKGYSPQHRLLGGKGAWTKFIRSLTAESFAVAQFTAIIKEGV